MAQSTNTSVYPAGSTVSLAATTTSSQAYVTAGTNNIGAILVENLDATNDVYVNWSQASTVTAVVPSAGNPTAGICIQSGTGKVINVAATGQVFDSNITVAANAVTGTATVQFTPVF